MAADAGCPMGFQSIFARKALPKRVLPKRKFLTLIDLYMDASPQDRLIVAQHPSFLKPRESGPLEVRTNAPKLSRTRTGSFRLGLFGGEGAMR